MEEQELKDIIEKRLNCRVIDNRYLYDGFDMSGFDNSFYSNLELLARFKDLINYHQELDNRDKNVHFPIFWKGCGKIIKLDVDGKVEDSGFTGGWSTQEIIYKLIILQNPRIINKK